ncbi:ubiquitin-protein ligase Ufd4, putative [Talaromyces stipitatus ATCC 10500]|uniref:HECT-type E3 ubiquitin transferase n=1 Tax=Talaromyces stipitatus (strain ATCC 10500 / CBS 375.48 / QM 6759 / NRRL 1006) TaxID=441959 RepID=B8M317_TALSN|nr:ubiquitin-protein ligase Ufd4, putative [Talaromyces stipitatus ATCC 10500]EED21993.1 ubiquitin-protein ligase Ufd4, putative [Talaromyces stipitatus ATCC 10500]
MPPRTRSAARAENVSSGADTTGISSTGGTASRKRKATTRRGKPRDEPEPPSQPSSPPRKVKRQRTAAATTSSTAPSAPAPPSSATPRSRQLSRNRPAMSQPGPSSQPSDETSRVRASSSNSRRKSGRNGKSSRRDKDVLPTSIENHTSQSPHRRSKKRSPKHSADVPMRDTDSQGSEADPPKEDADDQSSQPSESNDDNHTAGLMDEDDGDPFRNVFGSRTPLGLQNTLRALTGMMTSMSSRLREILGQLRMKEDPSIQLIALQELSDLLLVSNEDNLSGQFSPDSFVKELVKLMQPSETGEENPEIMLLACRCLANMMEALRGSVTNVVYGGAVPVLCQKLLDIQFIDLAEQALSTLAKISEDFPASIVREGGLTACLTYLDFFPTSTQRTAVTTAANCCRSLPGDSFPVIRDVMPTLLNVLSSNDQRVVEQACLCVSRIVESFRNKPEKLEELIEPAMLKAILRLLVPGTTNLIGPHIHTQFLRVLGIVAQASPRLSVELLRMDVVDTLYQILTGVSAPRDDDDTGVKVDNVVIMQALVHRPREQVFETLGVICELLPGSQSLQGPLSRFDNALTINLQSRFAPIRSSSKLQESADKRRELLAGCKPELKRFAMVLLPTLTDAYSSTVNLGVRQKVLLAQLKIIQEIDAHVLEDALRAVPYASFLAAILSQQDHPLLVSYALQCAELLFERLPDIYRYQFHREGVIAEIAELAAKQLSTEKASSEVKSSTEITVPIHATEQSDSRATSEAPSASQNDSEDEDNDDDDEDDEDQDEDDEEDDDEDQDRDNDDASESESESSFNAPRPVNQSMDDMMQDHVITTARNFVRLYEQAQSTDTMAEKANKILKDLQALASKIKSTHEAGRGRDFTPVFESLASYFDGDAVESITSTELLRSGIIDVLVESFTSSKSTSAARVSFLKAFMGTIVSQKSLQGSVSTPFSKLIHKLHDLLSRTEHFEVITVGHNSLELTRSNATYMLGKQVRLRLVADEGSNIPRPYKNIMVSIHAIATFKSLDDFLRPRISLSERPRPSRNLDFLSQLANADRLRESLNSSQSSTENNPSSRADTTSHPGRRQGIPKEILSALRGELDGRDGTHRFSRTQPSHPADEESGDDRPLECADEKQLSEEDDDEDEGEDHDEELNAIVDDLDDELSDAPGPEPTAVNMEIASSGKVTARKEDGTRVATPSQSQDLGRGSSSAVNNDLPAMGGDSLAMAGRPFSSYAAAVASVPQDWHIQFSIDGEPITNDTTIYRAIHHSRAHNEDGGRNVWTSEHTVQFKRMPGPPPPEASSLPSVFRNTGAKDEQTGLPLSLSKEHTTGSILQLLRVLHEMNAHLDDLRAENQELTAIKAEPVAQFINNKLTAKLNRQLEEPLIVASSCLPNWSEDLAREFPFLFPFETRHLFLQSTAFGYSRSMMRWQNSQPEDSRRDLRRDDRPFLGRLQRQKVRISRSRILDSAMKVMELYGSSASILEVEYFEEVGTGLGPTLEFYSTVSKEFSKKKLKIWRENESADKNEYAFGKHGLFPAPMSVQQAESDPGKKQLHLFKSLGKFVARSMLDSRIIDINFNPTFFRVGTNGFVPSLGAVKTVDESLANSLQLVKRFAKVKSEITQDASLTAGQKIMAIEELEIDGVRVEDLGLDFTLPGYPTIELIENGSNINVDLDNVELYLDRVIDFTLGKGVERQIEAFRAGFSQVFPYSALRAFTPNELVMLFGRIEEDWSMETLMDSIKADHGFNMDSKSVRNLLQTMSELDPQQRRDFLQFVTGSPKLPIGGFKSLTPMFTVVCRPSEPPYTPDDYLPSVMTCVNYLKLPDYSSLEVLRQRLLIATKEGQGAFHLS